MLCSVPEAKSELSTDESSYIFEPLFSLKDETDKNGNTKKSYNTVLELSYDEENQMYHYNLSSSIRYVFALYSLAVPHLPSSLKELNGKNPAPRIPQLSMPRAD